MPIVRRSRPDARLLLMRPRDEALADALEADHSWLELVAARPGEDDALLLDCYRRSWISVLPSLGEAFGLVLAESLACGRPVVGTGSSSWRSSTGRMWGGCSRGTSTLWRRRCWTRSSWRSNPARWMPAGAARWSSRRDAWSRRMPICISTFCTAKGAVGVSPSPVRHSFSLPTSRHGARRRGMAGRQRRGCAPRQRLSGPGLFDTDLPQRPVARRGAGMRADAEG